MLRAPSAASARVRSVLIAPRLEEMLEMLVFTSARRPCSTASARTFSPTTAAALVASTLDARVTSAVICACRSSTSIVVFEFNASI